MTAQDTSIASEASTWSSLSACWDVAQSDLAVSLTTCTLTESPGPRSPKEHSSVWEPGLPVMVQGSPAGWLAMDQSRSAPAGSGSLRATSCAVPVPSSSLLLMVMVKPIGSPAFTGSLSCVLVADRFGQSTSIVAELWLLSRRSSASFEAETVAVLAS